MRISEFELYRYSLPLVKPVMLAGGTLPRREGLLLKLCGDDGSVGWGESAPLPGFSKESLEEAEGSILDVARSLIGYEIAAKPSRVRERLNASFDRLELASSVRFGCELALWNLCAESDGVALIDWMALHSWKSMPLNGLLSGEPKAVLEQARRMRDDGYPAVKLKVGARIVEEDVDLVNAVRRTLAETIDLRLDANRAYSFDDAMRFARGVSGANIEYVEEPLADASLLWDFTRETGILVALDETLVDMEPASLVQHRYASAIVLKPTLIGGLSKALRFARTATQLGINSVVSSAYEAGIGTSALIALASSIGDRATPAGLDTYRSLASDVLSPPLELPAPRVDVREFFGTRRVVSGLCLERIH